MVEQTLNT